MVEREIRGRGTNIESFGGTKNGEPREILWCRPSRAPIWHQRMTRGPRMAPRMAPRARAKGLPVTSESVVRAAVHLQPRHPAEIGPWLWGMRRRIQRRFKNLHAGTIQYNTTSKSLSNLRHFVSVKLEKNDF